MELISHNFWHRHKYITEHAMCQAFFSTSFSPHHEIIIRELIWVTMEVCLPVTIEILEFMREQRPLLFFFWKEIVPLPDWKVIHFFWFRGMVICQCSSLSFFFFFMPLITQLNWCRYMQYSFLELGWIFNDKENRKLKVTKILPESNPKVISRNKNQRATTHIWTKTGNNSNESHPQKILTWI